MFWLASTKRGLPCGGKEFWQDFARNCLMGLAGVRRPARNGTTYAPRNNISQFHLVLRSSRGGDEELNYDRYKARENYPNKHIMRASKSKMFWGNCIWRNRYTTETWILTCKQRHIDHKPSSTDGNLTRLRYSSLRLIRMTRRWIAIGWWLAIIHHLVLAYSQTHMNTRPAVVMKCIPSVLSCKWARKDNKIVKR